MLTVKTGGQSGAVPQATPKKAGYKAQLKASEERNMALVQYLQAQEEIFKAVLMIAAKEYERLEVIITAEGEQLKPALADICAHVAPLCQDVEDMKLQAPAIAKLLEEGGRLATTEPPEQPAEPAEGDDADEN